MPTVFIPFTTWNPGGGHFGDALERAENLVPIHGALRPLRALTTRTGTLAAPTAGTHVHFYPTGHGTATYVGDSLTRFTGTLERLYTVDATAGFTDVSRAALYGQAVGARPAGWRFASFGNDVWAVNAYDAMQRRTNNTGLFADGVTSTFAPRPRFIAPVRGFMFGADLTATTGGTYYADEYCWSDLDDASYYDPSSTAGARSTSLANRKRCTSRPGQITGLVGGEKALLFKRNSTHLIEYIGGQDVFRESVLDPQVGSLAPSSLIETKHGIFFWSGSGFYRQAGYGAPEKISSDEIDQYMTDPAFTGTVFNPEAISDMASEDVMMFAVEDRLSNLIIWYYANDSRRLNFSDEACPIGIAYNPTTGAWTGPLLRPFGISDLRGGWSVPFAVRELPSKMLFETIGWDESNTVTNWYAHEEATTIQADARTKVQAIAIGETGSAHHVRINRILLAATATRPLYTFPEALAETDPPAGVFSIDAALDPYYRSQMDSLGDQISPKQVSLSVQSNGATDGTDWVTTNVEGKFFRFNLTMTGLYDSISGIWVEYEVI